MTGLLVAAAVAGGLAGCTAGDGSGSRSAMKTSEAAPAGSSGTPGASRTPVEPANPTRAVSCDVHTCTLTLSTREPRELRALGATLFLDGVRDGVASLTVGDGAVECSGNESVEAGPLTLFCDDVTDDSVTLTAEVG